MRLRTSTYTARSFYVVEAILKHRTVKRGSRRVRQFLVHWKDFHQSQVRVLPWPLPSFASLPRPAAFFSHSSSPRRRGQATWEPFANLKNCEALLEYQRKRPPVPRSRGARKLAACSPSAARSPSCSSCTARARAPVPPTSALGDAAFSTSARPVRRATFGKWNRPRRWRRRRLRRRPRPHPRPRPRRRLRRYPAPEGHAASTASGAAGTDRHTTARRPATGALPLPGCWTRPSQNWPIGLPTRLPRSGGTKWPSATEPAEQGRRPRSLPAIHGSRLRVEPFPRGDAAIPANAFEGTNAR